MYAQTIPANPHIPCKPGWCLAYVNEVFGVPKRFGSATAAWEASATKHKDRDFPVGVWIPVWYALANEPAGHVVLRAPDGSVFSTSDLGNTPHHHPDLADLEAYYAYYGMPLTYRGWTEDVEGTRVITPDAGSAAVTVESDTITRLPQEDTLSAAEVQEIKDHINAVLIGGYDWKDPDGTVRRHYGIGPVVEENQRRMGRIPSLVAAAVWGTVVRRTSGPLTVLQDLVNGVTGVLGLQPAVAEIQKNTAADIAATVPDELAKQVVDALAARLQAK